MCYKVTSVVLYIGKYNNDQRRAGQSEWWCQISFGAREQVDVPEEFTDVNFPLKPGKGCTYSQFLDDASSERMLKFCRQPGSAAKKINDLCTGDDRLAYEVPVEILHTKPESSDHIGLKQLKFFVFTVENEKYGFTTEEHFFGRDYEKIDNDGQVVRDRDGRSIIHNSVQFCYWTNIGDFSRDAQLAAELRHWRVVESTTEVLQRLVDEFNANKK